jgi:uncharacterized protein
MIAVLEEKREEIAELCRQFDVCRLEVFGSAAEGDFDPERSDVDFIVEYCPDADLGPWLKRYFELQEALEGILGRSVDLVMMEAPAFENPYFAREANRTRRLLYAA